MGQPLINLEEGWRAIRDWRFTFDLTIDLLVAVGLAALIAYHPKRPKRLTNLEQLDQIHTLLMYPVVGVIVATVDPASGDVTNASVAKSTGSSILDDAAVSAFRRWRFRPGSVSKVNIPITFTLTGASY